MVSFLTQMFSECSFLHRLSYRAVCVCVCVCVCVRSPCVYVCVCVRGPVSFSLSLSLSLSVWFSLSHSIPLSPHRDRLMHLYGTSAAWLSCGWLAGLGWAGLGCG